MMAIARTSKPADGRIQPMLPEGFLARTIGRHVILPLIRLRRRLKKRA